MTTRELLFEFESLGLDCEFGSIQRHFEAAGLGLFRWGEIKASDLVEALNTEFRGFAEPERIRFEWRRTAFIAFEETFNYSYHTNVHNMGAPLAALRDRESKRLRFLAKLFMEELRAARKIFVCKRADAFQPMEIEALADAISNYGPNTLLLVEMAREGAPGGRVERLKPGVMRARAQSPPEREFPTRMTSSDEWLSLCKAARAIRLNPNATGERDNLLMSGV